jgi:hypothetical protein
MDEAGPVCVFDYNGDGWPDIDFVSARDLYVMEYGKNVLYHNNGNGTFTVWGLLVGHGLYRPGRN